MSAPAPVRVIQRRTKGWRMPPNAMSVARPTRWGNPFPATGRTRVQAVDAYREWIMRPAQDQLRQAATEALQGKDLACWCPGPPCHADVLLAIANGRS
ncbi:MAG: DUF4326 domain-containing protein [Actinomycetota bacterium]|nr:DUF4326 domain-containing protein [Actinomycetota bacterium]